MPLTSDQRAALTLLADNPRGRAESIVPAPCPVPIRSLRGTILNIGGNAVRKPVVPLTMQERRKPRTMLSIAVSSNDLAGQSATREKQMAASDDRRRSATESSGRLLALNGRSRHRRRQAGTTIQSSLPNSASPMQTELGNRLERVTAAPMLWHHQIT
jgi:hypothetical protein